MLSAQGQEDTQSLENGKSNLAEIEYCSAPTPLLSSQFQYMIKQQNSVTESSKTNTESTNS